MSQGNCGTLQQCWGRVKGPSIVCPGLPKILHSIHKPRSVHHHIFLNVLHWPLPKGIPHPRLCCYSQLGVGTGSQKLILAASGKLFCSKLAPKKSGGWFVKAMAGRCNFKHHVRKTFRELKHRFLLLTLNLARPMQTKILKMTTWSLLAFGNRFGNVLRKNIQDHIVRFFLR